MRRFDVCNGDADGLCAVLQWRRHEPVPAALITGLKRDIALLEHVTGARAGDEVNVFDLSLQRNHGALARLLDAGVRVRYIDHHHIEHLPQHPLLDACIDDDENTCTSLLVDRRLGGTYRPWALVGAYGDNLSSVADPLALACGFDPAMQDRLRRMGECINYNAYGDVEGDVRIKPSALYGRLARHAQPWDALDAESVLDDIEQQRQRDLRRALTSSLQWRNGRGCVLIMPDAAWGRRVQGTACNVLANAEPTLAHAVLRPRVDGSFVVSVRAPLVSSGGAHVLCSRHGGTGRSMAAGIDALPADELSRFIADFGTMPWSPGSH